VTRKIDLTPDIQDLYANLLELKARGGDWPRQRAARGRRQQAAMDERR
jgi:hypothetical protein